MASILGKPGGTVRGALQREGNERYIMLYNNALKLIIDAFERAVAEGRDLDFDELMSHGFVTQHNGERL